jgi:hypothetical protein
MLRWKELHPYNAVHVLRIDAPLDPRRLRDVIADVLEGEGLTGLELDSRHGRYRYSGGRADVALELLGGADDPAKVIDATIERQLNTPFANEGRFDPFRFFAIAGERSFHFGLAYDHFIAGGDSIVVLMKDLHDAYVGRAATGHRRLDRYPAAYGRLFARRLLPLLRGLPGLAEMIASCRTTVRPSYRAGVPPTNEYGCWYLPAADLQHALMVTRAWGVTLNDLLLALVLQAMVPLAGERTQGRRRMLAVASIINIRSEFQPPATDTFGQFLSSFRVTHPMPAGIGVEQLARDVRAATGRTKRRKLWLQTLIGIASSGLFWRFLSPARRAAFHAKNYPVWAGATLVNVDALWRAAGGGDPPQYIRGVPTGPMAPLVVAASTTQAALQLGLSWRTAAFSRENIDNIAARILAGFRSLPK